MCKLSRLWRCPNFQRDPVQASSRRARIRPIGYRGLSLPFALEWIWLVRAKSCRAGLKTINERFILCCSDAVQHMGGCTQAENQPTRSELFLNAKMRALRIFRYRA